MKVNNINSFTLLLDNEDELKLDTKDIKSIEIDDKPIYIENNIAYKARVIIDKNAKVKHIFNDEEKEESINYLCNNNNVVIIDLSESLDEYSIISIYGNGNYSENQSLYQHSYYEVDDNGNLTDNFIFEFYTDFFTDDISTLSNVYDLEKIIDDNFIKYNPLGYDEKDRVNYKLTFSSASKYLYNLGDLAKNEYVFTEAINGCIDKDKLQGINKSLVYYVEKIIYEEWFNRKVELEINEEE